MWRSKPCWNDPGKESYILEENENSRNLPKKKLHLSDDCDFQTKFSFFCLKYLSGISKMKHRKSEDVLGLGQHWHLMKPPWPLFWKRTFFLVFRCILRINDPSEVRLTRLWTFHWIVTAILISPHTACAFLDGCLLHCVINLPDDNYSGLGISVLSF